MRLAPASLVGPVLPQVHLISSCREYSQVTGSSPSETTGTTQSHGLRLACKCSLVREWTRSREIRSGYSRLLHRPRPKVWSIFTTTLRRPTDGTTRPSKSWQRTNKRQRLSEGGLSKKLCSVVSIKSAPAEQ